MKRMFNANLAILAIFIAFGFVMVSCPEEPKDRDELFESYGPGSRSITVSNMSGTDLVAFKSSLSEANLIGGVSANSQNHGFKKDVLIFPADPVSFQMIFITREHYNQYKNNLASANNLIFIRTWVFWNGQFGDNEKVYQISDKLGGNHTLQIFGPGNYDVEFRENGVSGPTIGYAPKGMSLTNLKVGPGDYFIFPIFQRYNSRRDLMETIIPIKPADGNIPEGPFNYNFNFSGTQGQTRMLNLGEASGFLTKMQSGVVYVYVNNALSSGQGIRAYRGSVPFTTPEGHQVIDGGDYREFAIMLPQQGSAYASSITVSFSVMLGTTLVDVVSYETLNTTKNKSYTLLADMMYWIDIQPIGGVQATIELRKDQVRGPTSFAPESDGTAGDTGGITGLTPPSGS